MVMMLDEILGWIMVMLMVIMDVAFVYGIWIEWRRYRLFTRAREYVTE